MVKSTIFWDPHGFWIIWIFGSQAGEFGESCGRPYLWHQEGGTEPNDGLISWAPGTRIMGWYGGDLVGNPRILGLQWDNWLVVWNILYFSIYWEESSQLTNSYFSEGFKPPTSYIYSSNSWALLSWIWYSRKKTWPSENDFGVAGSVQEKM